MLLLIKNNYKIIISFIILSIFCLGLVHLKNTNRHIIEGPDDKFHYLMKPANLKNCEIEKCYFENLYKYTDVEKLTSYEKWFMDRQIHRIYVSYHPLYTFVVDKLSNKNNLFQIQYKIDFIGGILVILFLLFYLNKFLTNKNHLLLITVLLATHQYSYHAGIQHFIPFILSAFIGSVGMITQYQNKLLSYLFYAICILLHKIGLIISLICFSIYYIDNLISAFEKGKFFEKIIFFLRKEVFYIILFFLLFFVCFFIKYDFYQTEKVNIFSAYETEISLNSILLGLKANYVQLAMRSWDTFVLRFNPLLIPFFFASFFISLAPIFKVLKIYTILLFLTCIIFVYGIEPNSFGARTWPLIVTNYLILSFIALFKLARKSRLINFTKNLIIILIPIQLFININQNVKEINEAIINDNLYLDSDNISIFKNEKLKNDKKLIYFNSSESIFYYYLISGYINKNFISFFSFPDLDEVANKISYVVKNNPLNLVINNKTYINIYNIKNSYELILLSNKNQKISLNNKEINLIKGKNYYEIKDTVLKFENIKKPVRLIGLKVDKNQKLFWPWYKDISLEYKRSNFMLNSYNYNLPEKIYFNLPKLLIKTSQNNRLRSFDIEKNKFDECEQTIVSDVDSSLIFKVDCN